METNIKYDIKHKKAVTDIIILVVMLLCVAVTLIISLFVGLEIKNKLIPVVQNMSGGGESVTALNQMMGIATNSADWLFFMVFIIGIIGIIISSFLFYVHPVFVVLFIILSIGINIVAVIVSNIYSAFMSTPALASMVTYVPMTNWIMYNLPLLTLMITAIGIVVIYVKPQLNSGMPNTGV
jgi:hypothetical protein